MSCPEPPAARRQGHAGQQVDAEEVKAPGAGLGRSRLPSGFLRAERRGWLGPDGAAEDAAGGAEAGCGLCQLALIPCSMVRC